MPNATIDLRKLRNELKGVETPLDQKPSAKDQNPRPARPFETEENSSLDHSFEDVGSSPALLEWRAPEFEPHADRGVLLPYLGALMIIGGIIAAILGNYLFAIFLGVAGGLVVSYAFRTPHEIKSAVTSRGLAVGNHLYEFENLDSFWIFYDPPLFKELSLHSKKMFMPLVRVPLGGLDPLRLREVLLRFLREERQEQSVIDIIAKRLGF